MKWMFKKPPRKITILLAITLCIASFSSVAYAGGGDYYDDELPPNETEQVEETTPEPTKEPTTTPTIEPGTPFTEDGITATRDLLYDKHTNKQFITVETRNGHTLYIIIDYDKLLDEEEERYQTYFLNPIDEADLQALLEDGQTALVACTCTEKCTAGHVNTNCPVCKTDMTNCMGKESQPTEPEPATQPDETEQKKSSNLGGILVLLLLLAAASGGVWYFKFRKPKASVKGSDDLDEFDFDDYDEEDDTDFENESDDTDLIDEEDEE